MKKHKSLLITLIISLLFVSNILAQTVSSTFEISFPELHNKLKIDDNTKYDKNLKEDYRTAFYKLISGADEIRQFEIGVLIDENMTVFEGKQIKKIEREGKLDSLKNFIEEHKNKITKLMWGKERFGADSIRAIEKYIPFKDAFKAKNYDESYGYWTVIFKEFPTLHSSVYSAGMKIVKIKLKQVEGDSIATSLWRDTLMQVYDQAILFYPKYKGYYLGQKATDYYAFNIEGTELNYDTSKTYMQDNYAMFMEAIEISGDKTSPRTFYYAMMLTAYQFQLHMIKDTTVVIDNYMNFSSTLDIIKSNQETPERIANVQKIAGIVDKIFFSLEGVATCEVMIGAFQPQFDATPEDTDLLKKILVVLAKKDCTDSELFINAAVNLDSLEPSASSAARIAMLYIIKSKYEGALSYYEKAIEQETVDTVKAQYYFEAAKVAKELKKWSLSREYCEEAIKLKPNFGKPHLLISSLYASTAGSCGSDAVEIALVYCLAVDKCIKAKTVDPSITKEANSLIGTYSSRYPNFADAFQHNPPINEGQSFTVGGWIGRTTTVRLKK